MTFHSKVWGLWWQHWIFRIVQSSVWRLHSGCMFMLWNNKQWSSGGATTLLESSDSRPNVSGLHLDSIAIQHYVRAHRKPPGLRPKSHSCNDTLIEQGLLKGSKWTLRLSYEVVFAVSLRRRIKISYQSLSATDVL